LEKYKYRLEKRAIIKDGIKDGKKAWYEYQQINKKLDFDKEFIVYPNVSLNNNFTLSKGNIVDMTAFIIPSNDKCLLGILNSTLINFLMKILAITRRGGYQEYKTQYIEKIPIVELEERVKKIIENKVDKILTTKQQNPSADTSALEAEIDEMVYDLYGLTEEERKIVEEGVR
jgi:hypothetical protein